MAGDLNALPESETMQVFYRDWKESFSENAPTYPAKEPNVKIDYILFKPANRWRVLESKVIEEKTASDHRPILSVFELLKPN